MTTESNNVSPIMVNEANLSAIRRDSLGSGLSTNEICTMFNEILIEFERMEQSGVTTTNMFLNAVEEITDAVLGISSFKLLNPMILTHPLMHFLHQILIDLLENWQAHHLRLNIQESDIFLKIVLVFIHAYEQAPALTANDDRKRIQDLLATKPFLHLVREQIIDCTKHKNGMNDDPNICTLGLLTMKLLKGYPFFYSNEQSERLIDDLVMSCIDSYDYNQALNQLQHDHPLTDIDRFLLFTCWEYIPFVSTKSRSSTKGINSIQMIESVYDELLTRFEGVLDEPSAKIPSSLAYIFERCYQLLNIPHLSSFDKHAHYLIDYLTKMIENFSSTNSNDDVLTIVVLEAFSNLSKNTDVRTIMRKRQLTSLFKNYTSTNTNSKQRQLAFDILAEIMDEQEIHNNPNEMTAFFVDQLKNLDPNEHNLQADKALSSLKVIMQHEEIKNEFVQQGGLNQLISFIRDGDINKQSTNQLEDTLEILWSCAFNNPQALHILQQDPKLMAQVNLLLENAKQQGNTTLEQAAEGLIWKVEKEEQFKQKQLERAQEKQQAKERKAQELGVEVDDVEDNEQYDCMVSYSWADMDLAHRIFKYLTQKLGYKVWLDQEQMHGSTIEAMANAVEGANFILMCMSETYKRSANCQSEAEYAFNRKKHIIPIKMKADFQADGWLGFILGSKMYIDFGTYDFDKAVSLLENEIQLQKKKKTEAKKLAKEERKTSIMSANQSDTKDELLSEQTVLNKKISIKNLLNWNEDDVRNFLMKNNLPALVPLCDGIDGEELSNLYAMCRVNPTSMYRSLKFELLHGYHRILPISTFLRFLSLMRVVCGDGVKKTPKIRSSEKK